MTRSQKKSFEMNEQNALSTFKRLVGEVEEEKKEKVTSLVYIMIDEALGNRDFRPPRRGKSEPSPEDGEHVRRVLQQGQDRLRR